MIAKGIKGTRKHFIEAANLVPGNTVIWSSPAFREYGDARATSKPGDFFNPTRGHH
ncbi:MAG TPA: hypothetical protein VES96_01500 [Nitrospiraceae bacterium]|nr:hypothetical protein [Nitrospiraceae bacterium]